MTHPVQVNVVVTDAELVATVLEQVRRSHLDTEVVVTVQPSFTPSVRRPDPDAGTDRFKFIRGL